jgi:hypothetical protein
MTRQEAKELSLEVWRYLEEHPEIANKKDLPEPLYKKIVRALHNCPLCSLFYNRNRNECPGCPLSDDDYYCSSKGHPYSCWYNAETASERKEAAGEIVRMIEAWEAAEE